MELKKEWRGTVVARSSELRFVSRFLMMALLMNALPQSSFAMSNTVKSILTMLGGFAAASAIGYATTPEGTDPTMHGAYWGFVGATATGVVSLFL